jgi:hypothetical protein
MYELCDLDVKAAPFARRHLLKLTATAAARLVLAPHWPPHRPAVHPRHAREPLGYFDGEE